jgi:hypothetical protein
VASFLGICDVVTKNFKDTCNIWVAAGCVAFVCGPSAFFLLLAYRLYILCRHGDLKFEAKEEKSMRQAWRNASAKGGGCLMFPIFLFDEVNELRSRGSWSAESTSGSLWLWLLGDFTGGAWYYPAMQVARKMYLTSVMAVAEGKRKAVLLCVLFVADLVPLYGHQPFNDLFTLWCERLAALSNLLAVFSVTLPAFGVKLLPDMVIIAMATVGTGISAVLASVSSFYSCLRILPSQLARLAGCRDSCLVFLGLSKSTAAAVGGPRNTGKMLKHYAKEGTTMVTGLMYENSKEQAKQIAAKKFKGQPSEHNGDLAEETGEDKVNLEVIEIQLGYGDEAQEMEYDENGLHKDLDQSAAPQSTVEHRVTANGVRVLHAFNRTGSREREAGVSIRAVLFEGEIPTSRMRLCDILERSNALNESRSRNLLGSWSNRGPEVFTANDSGRERGERGIEVSTTEVVSIVSDVRYVC